MPVAHYAMPLTLEASIKYVYARHQHWAEHFQAFGRTLDIDWKLPGIKLVCAGHRRAGCYFPWKHVCEYDVAYAALYQDRYDETIAHEVAHAFQCKTIKGSRTHGGYFKFLMKHVAKQDESTYHHYQVKLTGNIATLLKHSEPNWRELLKSFSSPNAYKRRK